jgi:type III secretion protein J
MAYGCAVPIAGGLDEAQANRVVVALDRAGVGGEKEADPAAEGRFRVIVEREQAALAISTMRDEDLPTQKTPGLLDAIGKGSLVPSQLTEHTQYLAGLSGELENTLLAIDGVLSARVHLSIPASDPLREGPRLKPTASVLLKHRGSTPPIDVYEIKRLVAGAGPGLLPDDVAVVMIARPSPPASLDRGLARIGPLTLARGSVGLLRIVGACVLLVDVALVSAVLVLWGRLRRVRSSVADDVPVLGQPRRV